MKAWQKIIGLVLTTVLVLTFYVGHALYKFAKKISEGFQASGGASGGSATATNNDPSNPGEETQAEKETFDLFEYLNQSVFQQIPTTPVEAYDPSTALAQFDEDAPSPWDFDNKLENPKDILWGYVDSRCSLELWTAARTRAIFNTANNIEISSRGGISYYSNILGTLFHDPGQIAMVKVGEFFLDFAVEEIIEGSFERIKKNVFDGNMEAWSKATQAAKNAQKAAPAAWDAAAKAAKAAGDPPPAPLDLKKTYKEAYTSAYEAAAKEIEAREAKAFGAGVGRLKNKVMIFSKAADAVKNKLFDAIEAGLRGIGRGAAVVGRLARSTATRAVNSRVSQAAGKMFIRRVGGSQLGKLGQKAAQKVLAKLAGMRAISLFAAVGRMMGGAAAFFAIPIVGQIIGWAMFALSLFFLAIVPQVLSILADLDEDSSANQAQSSVQGCPPDQPFNIIAAMTNAMGSTATEIVLAVPVIGDGIAAFGPYLCSSNDLSSTSFRQSFRAPPYYFDTTLSLYYTEKPKMLDGGYNGTVKADPMYTDPSKFKLRMTPDEYFAAYGVKGDPDTLPFWSETVAPGQAAAKYYHPWIDYAHKEILDKMAAFYYDMAKRNQQYDFDGNASFEYISRFMGVIASSQLSCDVQVKLKKVTFNPVANVKISEEDVPEPDTAAQEEMGCTFHDRRFYFTIDYTKCSGFQYLSEEDKRDPTKPVLEYLLYLQPATRLSEYRKMFVVIGCTNTNGTAPAVIDRSFGNGDFVGEAPVGLGPIGGQGYKPPILKTSIRDHVDLTVNSQQDVNQFIPNETSCNAVSSVVTSFSVTRPDSSPQDRAPSTTVSSSIPDIVVTAPDSYVGPGGTQQPTFSPIGVTEKTPTTDRGSASTFADISRVVPNPTQGNLIYVVGEGRKYIFWASQWQRYSPMPVWSAEGADALNRFYLTNTTKYWRFTKVTPSLRQQGIQGLYGGFMGSLPLFFGFEGGAVATAFDVGGVNSKVACAYSDVLKQTGTYAINGFIVTSETHFVLNKGPLIQFAPGYEPSFEAQKCKSIPITQKVCANRYMIRSLNKKFMKEVPGRRIKVISGIVPSPSDKTCIYFTQNVQINADKTDIEGSENLNAIVAKPVIGDTSTCSFQWAAEPLLVAGPDYEYAPIPFDSTMFAPPLTAEEFAALPNDPRLANGRRTFQRKNCSAANYGDCSKELIRTKLMNDFNAEYMKVDGNPTLGYYTRITSIQDWRTPDTIQRADPNYPNVVLQPKVMSPDPVCVYKATVETETVSGVKTMNNVIIKMLLDESTDDTCLYTIKSHDFPRKMFTTPVPSSGVLELPSLIAFNTNENFKRAGCSDEYKDCSNPAIINRLMNQFNQRNRTTKILQVIRANTPIVPGDSAAFCDFEADVFGNLDGSAFLERQTLRFKLTPTPPSASDPELKCLYDINFDWSDFKRGSGKSILKNTDEQVLKSPYYWPVNYVSYIRNNLNTLLSNFRGLAIPETLKDASKDMRDKLGTLQNRLKSAEEIIGCISNNQDLTKQFTCRNPLFVRAFIRRYNFDNWPKYPKSQFGSTKRSIVGVRLAGSAGGTECHIELIEREETFVNFLKEPMVVDTANLAAISDTALLQGESNKKQFLRQYKFNVGGPPQLVGGNCLFTMAPFTEDDIKNRTFDIRNNQEAYGINMEPTTPVQFTDAQKTELAPDLEGTRGIYAWNTQLMGRIRDAVNAYANPEYGKENFVRMELERLYVAVNVQPNILEFGAEVKETYKDPDFGFIAYRGEKVILTAYWDNWDPVAAAFPGGTVPPPSRFTVMNIMRSEVVEATKLKSDRAVMEFAPYLYFTTTDLTTKNFSLDYNPKTERTRLVYPAGATGFITPDPLDRTKWKLYVDASSRPADFTDASPPRLYVTL